MTADPADPEEDSREAEPAVGTEAPATDSEAEMLEEDSPEAEDSAAPAEVSQPEEETAKIPCKNPRRLIRLLVTIKKEASPCQKKSHCGNALAAGK